jgi:hypothetical protein
MEPAGSWWGREPGISGQSNPAIFTAIDAVRSRLPDDAEADAVVSALYHAGLDYHQCIFGVRMLCNVGLANAKRLVLENRAFADKREAMEAVWVEFREFAEVDVHAPATQDPDLDDHDHREGHTRG